MKTFCFILMCLAVILALTIVLVVLLKNGKFIFSVSTKDKKVEVEQNKKNLENSEKELEDLKNKYLYLSVNEE